MEELENHEDYEEKERNKRRVSLENDAFKAVLSTRNGRRFVWNLMGKCGFSRNSFSGDNDVTNFNCGRQSVATDLMVDIDTVHPDAFMLMIQESREDTKYVNGDNGSENGDDSNESDSITAFTTGTI